VEHRDMSQREQRAFDARVRLITTTIAFAALVATPDNNGQDMDVDVAELQEGEVVLGYEVEVVVAPSGGGVSGLTMIMGPESDPDGMIASGLDLVGAAAGFYRGTAGVRPMGNMGGETIVANFDPDGGHKVSALTAGSIKVHLYVAKADARTRD
jgi:hypothetical protein